MQTNPNLSEKARAEQQATEWMSLYDAQYRDTMVMMVSPTSTAAQRNIGRQKAAILDKVYPLIKEYKNLVKDGKSVANFDTALVFNLLNKLVVLSGGKH